MQHPPTRRGDPGESPFDNILRVRPDGSGYWSARELMPLLGYDRWENFLAAIERARLAATNSGHDSDDLFRGVTKKGGGRPQQDFELARYACYLIALNGDPRKPEVAEAQTYFVVRTREAETAHPLAGPELLAVAVVEAQQMLAARDSRIHQLEQQATEDAPKVLYVDTYVTDTDLLKLRTVASNLHVGEQWLRDLLLRKRWIYRETASRWSESKQAKEEITRYSSAADKKRYFRPVEVHDAPRFRGEVMHTLKVTPQGAEAIARLVAKEAA